MYRDAYIMCVCVYVRGYVCITLLFSVLLRISWERETLLTGVEERRTGSRRSDRS